MKLKYLIEEIQGMQKGKSISHIMQVAYNLDLEKNPNYNSKFVKELGYTHTQPPVSLSDASRVLAYLKHYNLDINVISKQIPNVLDLDIDSDVKPKATFLRSASITPSRESFKELVEANPKILLIGLDKLKERVDFLKSLGIKKTGMVIRKQPEMLSVDINRIKQKYKDLKNIGVRDPGRVLEKLYSSLKTDLTASLKEKVEYLKSQGINNVDFIVPSLYGSNLKKNIIPKMEFLKKQGYPLSELGNFPLFFKYSLDNRIIPRFEFMKEQKKRFPLQFVLAPNDEDFAVSLGKELDDYLMYKPN